MEYASGLLDGIGARLTGSPNLDKADHWTQEQFTAMGCSNVHLEGWGEFGSGWRQLVTWVAMAKPDTAVFVAQAAPWSPPTKGTITAEVIAMPAVNEDKDIDQWKGKLTGKIILYGDAPKVNPNTDTVVTHYDAAKLQRIFEYPLNGDMSEQHYSRWDPEGHKKFIDQLKTRSKLAALLNNEHPAAVLRHGWGEAPGVLRDDGGTIDGVQPWRPEERPAIPTAVIADEAFGRISRLLSHQVPVEVTMSVLTEFTGDHVQGYNSIAEIAGTDSNLKDQVVMVGAHLDSWIPGTGATDNGAGSVVAMEAMRILNAIHVQPRRTIRVALWSGEEQGDLGSAGYAKAHFGSVSHSTSVDEQILPETFRTPVGPLSVKPEQALVSAYFNLDNGGGRIFGIYAENNAAIASVFEQWIAPLRDLGVTTVSLRNSGSTDNESFNDVGIPGFQFIQDERDYMSRSLHSNQDVYERLSAEDLKQAAVVEAIFIYNAAMRDEMLPRTPLPHPELREKKEKPLSDVMPGERPKPTAN
jgi:hypothetical protein